MKNVSLSKILVIGSNSFSGADFIDFLLEDVSHDVVGVSRSAQKKSIYLPYKRHKNARFKFYQLDLLKDMERIIELIDFFKPEYVINFAGQIEVATSWRFPGDYVRANTLAVTDLVHTLKDRAFLKKYVHVSTPEIYGTCQGSVKENAPINPCTPYAVFKAAADMMTSTYHKNYQFPVVTVRSTNVYGAHQQLFRIIPRTIIYIKLGKKIPLHGGGKAVKSFIHIRDISRGEYAVMKSGKPGEIYHLSPDQGITIKELVKLMCRKSGVSFEKVAEAIEERLGQDAAYTIDSSKARKEFSWNPLIGLDEGLESVQQWIEKNWNIIQKESLEYAHKH